MAGGVTPVIPGVALNAAYKRVAADSLPMTTTGCPAPAGRCWASTCSPTTESGWPRNDCAFVSPFALNPTSPSGMSLLAALGASGVPALARGDQRSVAGSPAKEESVEDARARPVAGGAGWAAPRVAQGRGAGQRDARRDHRQQPQDRAAVGDQQQ